MADTGKGGLDRRDFIKRIGVGALAAVLGIGFTPRKTEAFGSCSWLCLAQCQVSYNRCCSYQCQLLQNCDDICPGCAARQFECMQLCCSRCREPCPTLAY
jgi:anaerobic selenocysteine-containing dehydrogenase